MMLAEVDPYEMIDITEVGLPPRSLFYCLEPVAVGTPFTESFASYITRLAASHGVKLHHFLARGLAPILGQKWLAEGIRALNPGSGHVNGCGNAARNLLRVLGACTMRQDLSALTALPWSGPFAKRRLVKASRAWCPSCYAEQLLSGIQIYDPLLWALRVVTVCTRHRRRLITQCPHCCTKPGYLGRATRPGCCSKCGQWLGEVLEIEGSGIVDDPTEEAWHSWVFENVGSLISSALTLAPQFGENQVTRFTSWCVDELVDGNQAELARQLGVPKNTLHMWRTGKVSPDLRAVLQLAYYAGLPLLDVLTRRPDKWVPNGAAFMPLSATKRLGRRKATFNAEEARAVLELALHSKELPPPTVKSLASSLGCDRRTLYTHMPHLCREISARWRAYRSAQKSERIARTRQTIRDCIKVLHHQGVYPSHRRVQALLRSRSSLKHIAFVGEWREAMHELGLKHSHRPVTV